MSNFCLPKAWRLYVATVLFLTFAQHLAFAQCDPPTGFGAITVIDETCPGNGQITLSDITPAVTAPFKYQFALYTSTGTEVETWQDASIFANLEGGQYQVYFRTVCPTGVSETQRVNANVAALAGGSIYFFDAYPEPAINCCTGSIYAEAYHSSWQVIPQYSLVNSLNAVDISSNYVRPKQANPEFKDLCAGTYYVRVYDDCGNYQTIERTVNAVTRTAILNNTSVVRVNCNELSMYYGFYNTTPVVNPNVVEKSWIQWPDNSTDEITLLTTNSIYPYARFTIPISKLATSYNASQPFPASVQWPATVKVFYKDVCGTISEFTQVIANPGNMAVDLSNYNPDRCDIVTYSPWFIYGDRTIPGNIPFTGSEVLYSIDNGVNWQPIPLVNERLTFALDRGQTYQVKFDICGEIISNTIVVPAPEALLPSYSVRDATSCVGDLYVSSFTRKGTLSAVLTGGPASAYPLPAGVSINNGTGVRFDNLPFGDYTYTLTDYLDDNCIRVAQGTATITQRPFEVKLEARNDMYACVGKVSIGFWPGGNNTSLVTEGRPVQVEVLSQPAGAGLPATFLLEGWTDNSIYPEILKNMIPGDYNFRLVDATGTDCPRTTTASVSIPESAALDVDFDYEIECNGVAKFTSKSGVKVVSPDGIYYSNPFSGLWQIRFIDSNDQVHYFSSSSSIDFTNMTTTRTVSGIPSGLYKVQALLVGDECRMVEKEIYLGFKPITIPSARVLAGCNGSPDAATLVAPAAEGSGTYMYTLFQGSVGQGNQVAGPQSSHIFNNVSANIPYIVVATDECGTGTQRTASATESTYGVGTSAEKFCPGDDMTLSVGEVAGATYQWYKSGTAISGQTGNQLTIDNVQFPADNGTYSVNIYLQDCVLASNQVTVVIDCKPLPVRLSRFTAASRENYILLDWETTYESNSRGFSIERSMDGKTWTSIGFVHSGVNGVSKQIKAYQYQDHDLRSEIQLYRLKCIDLDDTFSYSRIRSVNLNGNEAQPEIFPNPVSKELVIRNLTPKGLLSLLDVSGKVVRTFTEASYKDGKYTIDVSSIPTGTYLLRMNDVHDGVHIKKIAIVR
jgi:hypothetical protein